MHFKLDYSPTRLILLGSVLNCVGLLQGSYIRPSSNNDEDNLLGPLVNPGIIRHAGVGQSICMEDLGCFVIEKEFYHKLYRPLNFLPWSRDRINTRFFLFTREQQHERHVLRAKVKTSVSTSTFKPERPTKFIVHGWLDTQLFGVWMANMKQYLLAQGDYNVIIVDWSDGNSLPYTQATANTRVVGAEIAFLIEFLKNETGLREEDVHIIGHSLGSHVAGYAGERLKHLGRITGLDPAEPYFQYMPPKVRLDRTDAQFVDIIHTDTDTILLLGLGMRQAVGHVDFYPNDGRKHPGCQKSKITSLFLEGLTEGIRRIVGCDHQRAVDFFHASVGLKNCKFVGHQCPNWDIFTKGGCIGCGRNGERCAIMGIEADHYKPHIQPNRSITMYLKTGGDKPFCLHQYQVEVQMANVKGASEYSGTMNFVFHGTKLDKDSNYLTMRLEKSDTYHPGSTYRYIVNSEEDLGEINWVTFQWKVSTSVWNLFRTPKIYLSGIKIVPIDIIDKESRAKATRWMCASKAEPIKSGESIVFKNLQKCQSQMTNKASSRKYLVRKT